MPVTLIEQATAELAKKKKHNMGENVHTDIDCLHLRLTQHTLKYCAFIPTRRSKNKTAHASGEASMELTCRVREGKDPEILTTITVPSRWGGWR